MFFSNKSAREVTVIVFFCFMVSCFFAGKVYAAESLHKEEALYCDEVPSSTDVTSENLSYVAPKNSVEEQEIANETEGREIAESSLMGLKEPENELEAMAQGRKKIVTTSKTTAYCACKKCCNKTDGITYYEVKAQQYRTVAADKKKYPNGTIVHIPAFSDWPNKGWFVVEDIGGAIKNNRIDIFFDSHKVANKYGIQNHEVEFYLP